MSNSRIGAQMFTLREHCKTASDIAKTCKRLKDIGFEVIQASAAGFNELEAGEIRKILDDAGLKCVATHRSLDFLRDVNQAADYHHTLGCELTALGSFKSDAEQDWREFAREFSQIGKALAEKGVKLGYHNHSHEWAPFGEPAADVQTPIRVLEAELDPSVWFEIDTYWVAHAGGDPAAWIERLKGRVPAVHVKDMTITSSREQKMCEVGSGNLNWPRVLEACRNAGVQWYLIERDQGDLDPFESLKISFENLKAMGVD